MGLPLAENGIFPSLTSPKVGVTPIFPRFALDTFQHPPFLFPGHVAVEAGKGLDWAIHQ